MSRPSITVSNDRVEQLLQIYRQPVLTPAARTAVMGHQTMDFRDFVFVVYGETVERVSSSKELDRRVLNHFMKRFHHPVHIAGQPVSKRYH